VPEQGGQSKEARARRQLISAEAFENINSHGTIVCSLSLSLSLFLLSRGTNTWFQPVFLLENKWMNNLYTPE
jgi:hypothetical protein